MEDQARPRDDRATGAEAPPSTIHSSGVDDIKRARRKMCRVGVKAGLVEAIDREYLQVAGTAFDPADFRNSVPRFAAENRKANQALVDLLARIAQRKNATPAQVALAWLLARKPWIVPIPGTTKLNRLRENLAAVAVELAPDDIRDIEAAASQIDVQGARYPEAAQRMINR